MGSFIIYINEGICFRTNTQKKDDNASAFLGALPGQQQFVPPDLMLRKHCVPYLNARFTQRKNRKIPREELAVSCNSMPTLHKGHPDALHARGKGRMIWKISRDTNLTEKLTEDSYFDIRKGLHVGRQEGNKKMTNIA